MATKKKKVIIPKELTSKQKRDGTTKIRKKCMLQALKKHKGLVTQACAAANITRTTFYEWKKNDKKFAIDVEGIEEFVLDDVENAAHELIEARNPTMIIFYLKCRAKRRGYVEKQEIEHSTGDLSSLKELDSMIDEYREDH